MFVVVVMLEGELLTSVEQVFTEDIYSAFHQLRPVTQFVLKNTLQHDTATTMLHCGDGVGQMSGACFLQT